MEPVPDTAKYADAAKAALGNYVELVAEEDASVPVDALLTIAAYALGLQLTMLAKEDIAPQVAKCVHFALQLVREHHERPPEDTP